MPYKSEDYSARTFLSKLRQAGVTLPRHPQRALTAAQQLTEGIISGTTTKSIARYQSGSIKSVNSVNDARRLNRKTASGNIQMALEKNREPLTSLQDKSIPFNVHNPEELMRIREWCRIYYCTHYLQSICVDIYAQFPVQGIEITCKDPEIRAFYEQLFFDELEYETFLIDFGREFWIAGEVNSLANFNESLGVWDHEEILNPDDIIVEKSPFSKEHRYKLRIPQTIRDIIDNVGGKANPRDINIIQKYYPEFLQMARNSDEYDGLDISNILLSRTINKSASWDVRGTPHMLRAFRQLIMEEALNAAQDAICDRLYSPLILAKLGSPDLGDGEPWIPDVDELDNFRDDMQMALASDFRFLAYHFGLDIQNVFGREAMPRFDADYDRLERKMLQIWGIGEELISGGSNKGAYASSALNREFVTQKMSTYQKYIQKHFKKRCEVVAEAQGHFDYEISNNVRVPIYEEIYEIDEETGRGYVRKRPKLLIPEINFASINLRDESTERQFLTTLKGMGVPISDNAFMTNIALEFKDEIEKVQEERVQKIMAEARSSVRAVKALESEGLPLNSEMQAIKEQMVIAEQEKLTKRLVPPEQVPPAMVDENIITTPVPAPNVAPDINNQALIPDETPQDFPSVLPRNQIAQRPEISDEMRFNAPRAASRFSVDPIVVDARNKLTSESVKHLVENRPWVDYLGTGARRRLSEVRESE